jgi:hypothetical protein
MAASCLAVASAGHANPRECPGRTGPSNFDLMVLASVGDSPQLLAMADYLSMPHRAQ